MSVLCLGEVWLELNAATAPELTETFRAQTGGWGAGFCRQYAALGGQAALLAQLGADPFGRKLAARLARDGVDCSLLCFTDAFPTPVVFTGEDTALPYRAHTAGLALGPEQLEAAPFRGAFAFCFSSAGLVDSPLRLAHLEALAAARDAGALCCYLPRLAQAARRTADWSDRTEKGKFDTRNSGIRPDRGYVGHKAAKMMKTSKVIEAHKERAIEEKSALLKNVEEAESLKIRPLAFFSERLLEIKELTVRYGADEACKGVSFSVFHGDRIALNGKNGCGKSSVFRAILGLAEFSGTILLSPRLKISYVPQNTDSLSGSLGEYARQYGIEESLFKAVLDKLGFRKKDFSADLSAMSAGQKKKAALARSLCESAHLYIWDEPLNYIDIISRAQIEELILAFRPSLLFVEHDSAFLRNIATKIVRI